LALLGRLPSARVDRVVMQASENLHSYGLMHRSKVGVDFGHSTSVGRHAPVGIVPGFRELWSHVACRPVLPI